MEKRFNYKNNIYEVKVKKASGFLWKFILSVFYFKRWDGDNLEVAMIDPFRLEILSIGDAWIPVDLYLHEGRHIDQVYAEINNAPKIFKLIHLHGIYGRLYFVIKYLYYNLRHGYDRNPFEVDAYLASKKAIDR